jgi:uncharacterized protein (TIGR02246 family)
MKTRTGFISRSWEVRAAGVIVVLCAAMAASGRSGNHEEGLTASDVKAITTTIETYRAAWLANDSKGVLKTFTDDAVLLPAHGAQAVVGILAIEKYWFTPGGPPTTITELNITVDQIGGNRTLAFARGLDGVAWTVTENGTTRRHSHPGTYLNVMKKLPDGSWRIQAHMWDDGPERVE